MYPQHYIICWYIMKSKEKSNKYLTIRIPETLMIKFRKACVANYKTMSEAVRDLVQKYIKESI